MAITRPSSTVTSAEADSPPIDSGVAYSQNYLSNFGQPTTTGNDSGQGTTTQNTSASGTTISSSQTTSTTLANGTTDLSGFPVVPGSQSGFTNNPPDISPSAVMGATEPVSAFKSVGDTFSRSLANKKIDRDGGTVDSDKRLQVIRARSAKYLYTNSGQPASYSSDRGPITMMRLLPGPDYDPELVVKGAKSDVSAEVKELVAGNFAKFFVTNLQMGLNEKLQIMQTFGDNEVVYYFGKQPIMMNISGLLFDSIENDWFSKFLTLYAGVLRGTQLAKSFSLVQIEFPNMIVTGSISGLSIDQNSQRDTDVSFSMQFLAKEVVPKPSIVEGSVSGPMVGKLIDFKAARGGVAGYSISSGTLGRGFMEASNKVTSLTSGVGGLLGGASSAANSVSSTVNSFRTNIFTPIFGVISSLTKIVKTTTGSIQSIVSSFTNPVNQVLRDIQSIATQANSLALMVENSVNDTISIPARTITNLNNTVRSVKNAAGTITRVPENISETFKRLYGSGRIKRGAAILSSGKKRKRSKIAVLASGAPYTPSKSNTL